MSRSPVTRQALDAEGRALLQVKGRPSGSGAGQRLLMVCHLGARVA